MILDTVQLGIFYGDYLDLRIVARAQQSYSIRIYIPGDKSDSSFLYIGFHLIYIRVARLDHGNSAFLAELVPSVFSKAI